MKKKYTTTIATTFCSILLLTSCTVDNADIPVTPTDEYTILYYGHGGGNREGFYLSKIKDFYNADADVYNRVNVVVNYKFSTTENLEEQDVFDDETRKAYGSKTIRWAIDPTEMFEEQTSAPIYGADNADITNPDSLANFIKWAVKKYPAKKYMLIVHDHGGSYIPHMDLPDNTPATTRGMLFDDGHDDKHFTVKSFRRALTTANVHFETIFMDACMMNNLEYQFELHDLCDYVIAPTYSKPSIDGAYRMIPQLLGQPSVDIEQALDAYCKACVESWDEGLEPDDDSPFYTDMTVTRTASIPHLGEVLREFTDRLCDTYTNGTDAQREAIDYCTASAIKVQINEPVYDAIKYMRSIILALPEVYDENFYNRMRDAFNNCIVAQYFSHYLTVHEYMVDYGVLLGAEGAYTEIMWENNEESGIPVPIEAIVYADNGEQYGLNLTPTDDPNYYSAEVVGEPGEWGSTLADTYEQLLFDKATGWSRWLRLNKQWPNIFCPSGLNFELPMPQTEPQKK